MKKLLNKICSDDLKTGSLLAFGNKIGGPG
jgi:hypothetical protein